MLEKLHVHEIEFLTKHAIDYLLFDSLRLFDEADVRREIETQSFDSVIRVVTMKTITLFLRKRDCHIDDQNEQHLSRRNRLQYLIVRVIHDKNSNKRHATLSQSNDSLDDLQRVLRVDRDIDEDNVEASFVQIQSRDRDAQKSDENLDEIVEIVEDLNDDFSIDDFVSRANVDDIELEIREKSFRHLLRDRSIDEHDEFAFITRTNAINYLDQKTKFY